ncbi:hypothetical protein AKACHI_08590 [Aquiluna sp. KACHI24]|nr:hypothetical protein AKACHI_08590 [Aquiluna sp. KACHI24]
MGAAIAVLGTVFHQAWIQGFPYGLMISFGLVVWAMVSLRRIRSRIPAWACVVVSGAFVFLFAQPNTDVMIPANFSGLAWSYGSITLAVLIAAFPRIRGLGQSS